MIKTYKILSVLLDYPTKETKDLLTQALSLVEQEGLLSKKFLRRLSDFINGLAYDELLDWQEYYTGLFDYTSANSLYLFDHVYGDSKKRGMAMVDLKQLYASEGLEMASNELPDYLPVLLEFIATVQTASQGADLLAEAQGVLQKIYENLKASDSPYAHLLAIVLYLASKGTAKPLTPQEERELEQMRACEACAYQSIAHEEETNEYTERSVL